MTNTNFQEQVSLKSFQEKLIISLYNQDTVDLLNISPEDINIYDIARSLSKICRFNGHIINFYSVAQHCVLCANLAKMSGERKNIQLMCLLHDASEAYCGDVVTPLKNFLGNKYSEVENNIMSAISRKYNVDLHANEAVIKKYDVMAYDLEVEALKYPNTDVLCCYSPKEAEYSYLHLFQELLNDYQQLQHTGPNN